MKYILLIGLFSSSLTAQAFLDFNSYGSDYKNNDWPVWTPMFWMDKVNDNNTFSSNRNNNYPYNTQPYNAGAAKFNMAQMPTPDQAYQAESQKTPTPTYMTPAAMSFANPIDRDAKPLNSLNHNAAKSESAYRGNF
ncbi:hypothetical protein [Candidatus Thioglobus sp.]